jgi:TonB family protein
MTNLLLWSAQAAVVIALAAALAQMLKSIPPRARLAFWQISLASALLLPVIRPWQQETVTAIRFIPIPGPAHTVAQVTAASWQLPSFEDALLILLALGIAIRLVLLCLGLFRLRQYRREARPFPADPSWTVEAAILASEAASSPVTFGFFRPVILVPARFEDLVSDLRDPILFHEILHVRRHDWLFALAEETLRSLLWFHPAIWYAVREIQLAREETVDREVVATMKTRETYVDALLAIATAVKGPEMATAPFFLRRGNLKRRVISLFREATMSKTSRTKTASTLVAACAAVALASWYVTGALPLKAAPQEVVDGPGVAVDMNGARLMHRGPIIYPVEALTKSIQGTITAQVRLDGGGNVIDATITSGPDELRKGVLESVLNWHFTSDSANSTRQITVGFAPIKGTIHDVIAGPNNRIIRVHLESVPGRGPTPLAVRVAEQPTKIIKIDGPAELLARLPVHVGDMMTPELNSDLTKTVREYDEHFRVVRVNTPEGLALQIRSPEQPNAPPPLMAQALAAPSADLPAKGIRVGGNVQANNIVSQEKPVYPPLAKAARVQGTVSFEATIAPDGTVQNLQVISGPPLLVQAAMQAVQKWVYKPTLLNGNPVTVVTVIDVNFTLSE